MGYIHALDVFRNAMIAMKGCCPRLTLSRGEGSTDAHCMAFEKKAGWGRMAHTLLDAFLI